MDKSLLLRKKILFGAIAIVLFFGCLELTSRIFVFPGSFDYIERRIMEHSLNQHKKRGEFRIFLYGESTMQGGALYPHSVIGKWLRLQLADLLPEDAYRNITVVNFGRMGSDSGFTADAFKETVAYKPDLAVFYTVHNDFCLAAYRPAAIRKRHLWDRFEDFCETLPKKFAFLNLFNRLVIKAKIERNKTMDDRLSAEDPWYPESDTPEAFREDANLLRPGSPDFGLVAEKFKNNVHRIIGTARANDIPIIFFEGLSRWRDYEPIRSVHGAALTDNKLSAWEASFSEAEALFGRGLYDKALELYRKCIDLDLSYALAYYRAAECYERLEKFTDANKNYVLANDNDYFPIHAPSLVNRFYEDIHMANMKGVEVIRTQELFERNSPNGIVDDSLTIDQIHPSPEGQALMALEIAKIMYEYGLPVPPDRWRWDKLRGVDEMKKALDLNGDNMFHIYTGTASYLARHYRKAARVLEKALAIRPKSVFARSWLAWTYWKMGERDKAMALYRELYRERPSPAAAFFSRHPDIEEALRGGKI